MDLTQAELGARIARAREAAGLSQAEVAERLGLDRSAVSRIEAGTRGVDSLELTRIADASGRPVAWFLAPQEAPLATVLLRAPAGQATDTRREVEWLVEFARDYELLRELVPDPDEYVAGTLPRPPRPLPRR